MNFPGPTAKQARILWMSVTALSLGILLALIGLILWGMGWVLQQLTSVLLPLAIAGIIAYLLDPLVDWFEKKGLSRLWSIWAVFLAAIITVGIVLAVVIPRLVVETKELVDDMPGYGEKIQERAKTWFERSLDEKTRQQAKDIWNSNLGETVKSWAANAVPIVSGWMVDKLTRVASWFGLIIGLALVPIYAFYFLLEEEGIKRGWTDYLPIHESRAKEELIFVLNSVNHYLILFFRGQVLVALCDGVMLTVGFMSIGLDYAILLGLVAGLLSIVPYLGVMLSIIPTMILAAVQFGDWLHPLLIVAIFSLVQFAEGFYISPKIMGDRVGLHPLTIIVAVMVGTALMGGIIGGILAIPLTAALRVLMFRYVWRKRQAQAQAVQ